MKKMYRRGTVLSVTSLVKLSIMKRGIKLNMIAPLVVNTKNNESKILKSEESLIEKKPAHNNK
jgi:flagellar assembly factor FliW